MDAVEAANELESIEKRDGNIHPEAVVRAARSRSNPLHPQFNWDNESAAHEHRLTEARALVRNLVFVEIIGEEEKFIEPAFVNVKLQNNGQDRGYMSTVKVLSNAELREQVIADALKGLEAWQKRWAHLAELGDVFRAIDRAKGRVLPVRKKARRRKSRPRRK